MKKILAMLIAAAAMVGVMGVTAMAEEFAVADEAGLVAALENAKDGDIINVSGEFALTNNELVIADGVTLNAPGVSGTIYSAPDATITVDAEKIGLSAQGNLTLVGENTVGSFSLGYYNRVLNIGKGASLAVVGGSRVTIGWGNTYNITGNISDAKEVDKATIVPSFYVPAGLSITGTGATFNVEDAYVNFGLSQSKNSAATNDFKIVFDNSIADFSNNLTFSTPTSGKTPSFDVTFKNSVMNFAKNLDFAHTECDVTIDNSTVTVGSSFRNDGKLDIVNESRFEVLSQIQAGEHGGNVGVITVDDSEFVINCSSAGHAVDSKNTGVIIAKNNAVLDIDYIKDTAIAKLDNTVIVDCEAVNNTVEVVEAPVALVGGTFYTDIKEAFKAVKDGVGTTVSILDDITITEAWDCRFTGSKFTVPVTIEGNGHTIAFTNTVYDAGNHFAAFRVEADATFKNLTFDMSKAQSGFAGRVRAISAKADLVVDNCTFIGNPELTNTRAIIFGETAGNAIVDVDVKITDSEFINWRRGITDNENAGDVNSVTITENTFNNADVYISASGDVTFSDNATEGEENTYVSIRSYTDVIDNLEVTNNEADIYLTNFTTEDTDYTFANNTELVYLYTSKAFLVENAEYIPDGTVYAVDNGEYKEFIIDDGYISTSETVELVFVPNTTYDDKALANTYWDIVLVADEEGIINRLNSADFTFVLETVDADDDMAYEIIATNEEIVINNVDNSADRYEFHYDGKTGTLTDTDTEILLGMVKFTGYGPFTFMVEENDTNAVHATTLVDNVVDTYTVNAGNLIINTDKDEADDGVIESEILVPTTNLTINIDFPNSVNNNVIAYQAMKVTVSGGDLANDIVIKLGEDAAETVIVEDEKPEAKYNVAFVNGAYVVTVSKALAINTSYNVTVEGAGYRTARYTVTMTEDKTLNFWNNVKDNDTLVEEEKASSAKKVTFLAGDIVKDSLINIYDLSAVVSYFGETGLSASKNPEYAKYDLNRDGKIDSKDVAYVLVSWNK